METDHQYIAESLPVGRGKARNPAKGISSTPPGPPCQPSSQQSSSSPTLLPQAHPWGFSQSLCVGLDGLSLGLACFCPLSTLPCAGAMVVLPIWAPHWLCPSLWHGAVGASMVSVQWPRWTCCYLPPSPAGHSVSQSQLWSQRSTGVTACVRCCNILPTGDLGSSPHCPEKTDWVWGASPGRLSTCKQSRSFVTFQFQPWASLVFK